MVTRIRGVASVAVEYRRRRMGKRREGLRRGGIVAVVSEGEDEGVGMGRAGLGKEQRSDAMRRESNRTE